MTVTTHMSPKAPTGADLDRLRARAYELRVSMLDMAAGKGEGYVAQGLGMADCLAALYFFEIRHDPQNPSWAQRDRFLLSTGSGTALCATSLRQAGR
jgi:transketolase